ncbi:MAG: hypothetical protein MJ202_09300 [Lentisphaeria bacterium]|nr:hypothetical protein [Lentisphaeria bacterium]
MPKLCDKCHKNPAVIHIRSINQEGKRDNVSYCIPCAMEILGAKDAPPGLKEVLDEMMRDMKKLAPPRETFHSHAEIVPGESHGEEDDRRCPHCGRKVPKPSDKGHVPGKCGHCLTAFRDEFRGLFSVWLRHRNDYSAEEQGLPLICGPEFQEEGERLLKMLKCYQEAKAEGREDGAELLKQEISGLRRHFAEAMRLHAKITPKSLQKVREFLDLPCRSTILRRQQFMRAGWLPVDGDEKPLVRLASTLFCQRTVVDLHKTTDKVMDPWRLEKLLAQDPLFAGGHLNSQEHSLFSKNNRVMVECGKHNADSSQTYLEFVVQGEAGENIRQLQVVKDFLLRLERRATVFVDPELGYYNAPFLSAGACVFPMEYLHIPALCGRYGLPKLRQLVQTMNGANCCQEEISILLEAPEGWPAEEFKDERGNLNWSGFLCLWDTRSFGVSLKERVRNLDRIARQLEKLELRERQYIRQDVILREELTERLVRSYGLLAFSRGLEINEAVRAVSQVWLGQELGCFPKLMKWQVLQMARVTVCSDKELFDLERGKAKLGEEPNPAAPLTDYRDAHLEELDDVTDVLWEEQDDDGETEKAPSDTLKKTSDIHGEICKLLEGEEENLDKEGKIAERLDMLEKLFDDLSAESAESDESAESAESDRSDRSDEKLKVIIHQLNRATMIRNLMKGKRMEWSKAGV